MHFSNTEMAYSKNLHRYVLMQSHVLEDLNIDLNSILNTSDTADKANAVEKFLIRVSAIIYGWIYDVNPLRFRTERELALNETYRPFIRDAMKEQILYMLNNGDLSAVSGVNIDTGMTIEARKIRSAKVAPLAKDILINADIVKAFVPVYEREIVPNYKGEGY